jgi:hypothetical protein
MPSTKTFNISDWPIQGVFMHQTQSYSILLYINFISFTIITCFMQHIPFPPTCYVHTLILLKLLMIWLAPDFNAIILIERMGTLIIWWKLSNICGPYLHYIVISILKLILIWDMGTLVGRCMISDDLVVSQRLCLTAKSLNLEWRLRLKLD